MMFNRRMRPSGVSSHIVSIPPPWRLLWHASVAEIIFWAFCGAFMALWFFILARTNKRITMEMRSHIQKQFDDFQPPDWKAPLRFDPATAILVHEREETITNRWGLKGEAVDDLLKPCADDLLKSYLVSKAVNKPENDTPALIEPVVDQTLRAIR